MKPSPTDLATDADRRQQSAWHRLCAAHAVRCFGDRTWAFFLPLYLSTACPDSLRPSACVALVQELAVVVGSNAVASWYNRDPDKRRAFMRITAYENIAVVLGGILICSFAAETHAAGHPADTCSAPYKNSAFLMGALLMGLDSVCSSMLSMVVSKQWVSALYVGNSARLASANALLARIDLGVAVLSPLLVSFVLEFIGGYFWVLVLLVAHRMATGIRTKSHVPCRPDAC